MTESAQYITTSCTPCFTRCHNQQFNYLNSIGFTCLATGKHLSVGSSYAWLMCISKEMGV